MRLAFTYVNLSNFPADKSFVILSKLHHRTELIYANLILLKVQLTFTMETKERSQI